MKRKTLTLTLSILACLALIGVGFASWIISAGTSATDEGSFIVDTVTDNRLVATGRWITITKDSGENEVVTSDDNSKKVSFGAPAKMENTEAWLTNNSKDIVEKLTVVYELTVKTKGGDSTAVTGLTSTEITSSLSCAATYEGYIVLPTAVVSEVGDGVYRLTLEFKWGSKFGGVNPYEYYNGKTYTDKLAQTALTDLGEINKLNSQKFTLTIDVKSK